MINNNLLGLPAFTAYALACLVLCINLLFLWAYSGVTRGKTKVAINEEDAAIFKTKLELLDPPAVARVLRAHSNAQANILPFLILGLLFVLMGGSATAAKLFFGIFAAARWAHSWAYLSGEQPWRTIFFTVGGVTTIVLMLDLAWMLIKAS
ncbi:MAG: MAPEG family protein [Stenotrophobium sp.]